MRPEPKISELQQDGVIPDVSPSALAKAAREYLASGWSLIPLVGKLPALPSWKEYQRRLPSSEEVAVWFSEGGRPPSGLGVVTGRLSKLVVVDCDSEADAAFWSKTFPSSPLVALTGGGGVHFYYAMPEDGDVRNRAGVLSRKIDIRGEGGYATAPPSSHPSGRHYAWQTYDAAAVLQCFDAAWLADEPRPGRAPAANYVGKVRNAVAYIRRIHAVAGEGGHNATFRAACKLRDAGLSHDEALAILIDWNETNASPPWSAVELEHKIRSAYGSLGD
jgi:putative DNA primase/helicase